MTAKTKSFQELKVWQEAHQFVIEVYKYTAKFPHPELYGLSSQFRRAAVSIPANICEGYAKLSRKDKVRFYNISQGSIEECRYYLILSKDLDYGDNSFLTERLDIVSKMLSVYIKKVNGNC